MNEMKPLEQGASQPLKIRGFTDELMDKYYELSFRTEIEDVNAYGSEWADLGHEFNKQDRPYMAAMCFSRAEFYGVQPLGAYVREISLPFSTLTPVEE